MYWDEPFHFVRVHPKTLDVSRGTLPPTCSAIEVHLPTPVLGRTLSSRQSPPYTLRPDPKATSFPRAGPKAVTALNNFRPKVLNRRLNFDSNIKSSMVNEK
ncbi:hypothetical protein E2C01_039814 [Portunus trituberculatus]|uniref:Uncharacterized protein n=1 Tax=Portunus trituberculatus TaxID=210409 RepID=A0A5B7FL00_PORTR|nr:hypothetical protein [Portunus trituberculatus]